MQSSTTQLGDLERLQGQVAIVTGASSGISAAIAKVFPREGAKLVIASRNEATLNVVRDAIRSSGGNVLAIPTDVTKPKEIDHLIQETMAHFGQIDILVNGVGGYSKTASIVDIAEQEWDDMMLLNLKSAFLCAKAVSPFMIEKHHGRIINIGSQVGMGPNPYGASSLIYGTAKAGLIGFSKHLAKDLGPHGITVNTVSPGTTATERVSELRGVEGLNAIAKNNPLGRLPTPEETAETVLFLASKPAASITGVNIMVNAGMMMY